MQEWMNAGLLKYVCNTADLACLFWDQLPERPQYMKPGRNPNIIYVFEDHQWLSTSWSPVIVYLVAYNPIWK